MFKLLSVDPSNYNDAPTEGIRRILESFTGKEIPKGSKLDGNLIEWIKMGTTVATNALLERKGEKFVYVTTQDFHDVLKIGTQARPELFNLHIKKPAPLYDEVLQVEERITIETSSDDPNQQEVDVSSDPNLRLTDSGSIIRIIKPLNVEKTTSDLEGLYSKGYRNLAIAFAHSFVYNKHEKMVKDIALKIGFKYVTLSSEISPIIGILNRGNSASIDAYLTPHVQKYIDNFLSSFSNKPRVEFMKSDGGLCSASKFSGLNAILSGPAGGVVGFSQTAYESKPVIGFDMGGTSTDVCRFGGQLEVDYENNTAGIEIFAPQLQIHTVAAGGGSILKWENGLFHAGPESASAHPGPACYKKGGPLTITDANLFLGRLVKSQFPNIFGPNADEPLDDQTTTEKFIELTKVINKDTGKNFTPQQVALGFLKVANETMSRSIREVTEARGFATKEHDLTSFGGAGGQHCCAIAKNLGINRIIIHKYSSILSAYGMTLADNSTEFREPFKGDLNQESLQNVLDACKGLEQKAKTELEPQLIDSSRIKLKTKISLNLKYRNSNTLFAVEADEDDFLNTDFEAKFLKQHEREFGFTLQTPIIIDSIIVKSIINTNESNAKVAINDELSKITKTTPVPSTTQLVNFESGQLESKVFHLKDLSPGSIIAGPALIIDETQTLLLEPNTTATILSNHIVITVDSDSQTTLKEEISSDTPLEQADPILLSVFGHRFMSIAEQMGRTLQRTSVSTSIKERLDFSCAIFDPDGGLVANAPHIPVHLGSMQYAIQYQHDLWLGKLKPGDVLVSNHPEAGGTHLPDITVITPVFFQDEIVFYVASRGHHQDIGGIGVTAMIPNSKELWQEGVSIKSFKLVSGGKFDEKGIKRIFEEPAKYPGSSATRNLHNNLSDLKAQISANQRGTLLMQALFEEYGKLVVQYYMKAIRQNSELAIRDFFKKQALLHKGGKLKAIDYFDDGTPVQLEITIDGEKGEAFFDFTGTGPEVYGPMNTPEAITHSCVIYVLRCLIDMDIPLNQGCLTPCKIYIPENTILNPSGFVAICGSTIAGQRITDVLLKAFGICAASQGCANSFGFGTGGKDPITGERLQGFTFAEAIGGGAGAGPWGGETVDACNVHCTNTRTTDIEIIEWRTPVLVSQWCIRKGSGGDGLVKGGNGAVREIEARIPLRVSILSERRVFAPYGMNGGEDGAKGLNIWFRKQKDGSFIATRMGPKEIININAGDRVQINTPGGGGYGVKIDN